MILESLRGYLAANNIGPLYISFLPPTSGIALYSMPSIAPDPKFAREGNYQYHTIQITSRFADYSTSEAKLYQVYEALEGLTGVVGEYDFVDCRSNQAPYQVKVDDTDDVHMMITFYIETTRPQVYADYTGYVINQGFLDWDYIINTPTTLSGYGITDGGGSGDFVPLARILTINGNAQNLNADRTWDVGNVFTTSAYANPDWITALDYSKLTNVPAISGNGTVTYVGLTLPDIFSVAGSPIVSSGTFVASLVTQSANTFFAGPNSGSPAIPTFRAIVSDDLPNVPWGLITGTPITLAGYGIIDAVPSGRLITINGVTQALNADRTWNVGDVFTTSSYANPAWITALDWTKITNTPTTTTGYGITDVFTKTETDARYTPLTRTITINGLAQDLSANRTWNVGDVFTTSAYADPSWITSLDYGKLINVPPQSGQGTVTYVGLEANPIFTISGAPITSSGTLQIALSGQAQNTFLAAPSTANGIPVFRTIVIADLPDIPFSEITETPTTLAGYGITDAVPSSRTITINGNTQDLSANRTWSVGDVFTTSAYNDPSWIVTLDWSKIVNEPAFGFGTVTSVALEANPIFVVSGSPITSNGTFQIALSGQNQNTFLAAPETANGIPIFRTIALADLPDISFSDLINTPTTLAGYGITDAVPNTRNITINGVTQDLSTDRTWNAASGTIVYVGLALPDIFTVSNTPLIGPGGTISGVFIPQPSGLVFAGPNSGADAIPTFRNLVLADLPDIPYAAITDKPDIGLGTVTSVGLSANPIFTVSGSPVTTAGTLELSLSGQAQNTFLGAPSTANGIPTFRTIVLADLPSISFADIDNTPTTLAGYGITDAYTETESDQRFVPSGLYPPISMYWSSSGSIYFVAHSGIVIGFPYQAGVGTLLYWKANAATPTIFSTVTTFPLIMTYNDILLVHASGVSIYKTATFPRLL